MTAFGFLGRLFFFSSHSTIQLVYNEMGSLRKCLSWLQVSVWKLTARKILLQIVWVCVFGGIKREKEKNAR